MAFDMTVSLSSVVASILFKAGTTKRLLALEHLGAIVGLLTELISILLCLSK